MIFDFIEWDEHNLITTPPDSPREIEQVIWNADTMNPHRDYLDRVLLASATDGGKKAMVIAQIVRDGDGVRPITAWEEER